ncbi:MAG: ABC transporter permease [Planctomycetes bacterium]|nr:ABC transporter permease [Planctomycetota bacterium]
MSFGSLLTSGTLVLAADELAEVRDLRSTLALTAGGFAGVIALLVIFLYKTRAGIIARATCKEALRQPVFALLLITSLVLLVFNTFVPFFSLGDDVKMLEICGLATILISGMLLAIWTSSMSIADEIDGKTAMTLLSKPINRRQFIVGKFVGIQTAVLFLVVPLVLAFWALIVYKGFYDARETSGEMTMRLAQLEANKILPPVVLSILEIAVMSAISVAISTRLPMMVNMISCLTIFVIGHLTPVLVRGNLGRFEPVTFVAKGIAIVLPAVENFNVEAAIVTGRVVQADYLAQVGAYSAAYIGAMILLAFILFEDRDLA